MLQTLCGVFFSRGLCHYTHGGWGSFEKSFFLKFGWLLKKMFTFGGGWDVVLLPTFAL